MSTGVYTGLNPFNFIRRHFLQTCLCLSAQRLSERTVVDKVLSLGAVLLIQSSFLSRTSEACGVHVQYVCKFTLSL